MGQRYYANAPATSLSSTVSASATSIVVDSTTGLPVNHPFTLIIDRGTASEEVVSCTGASGTTLSVTRGYDSTTAFSHSAGAVVEHGISAIDPREANTHVNTTEGVHGATGAVVGDTDNQTLTNKDLSDDTNTFPSSLTTNDGDQTLTNKSIDLGDNTVTGTTAEFNAALSDGDFATLAGTETLSNKTLTGADLTNASNTFPTSLVRGSGLLVAFGSLTTGTIAANANWANAGSINFGVTFSSGPRVYLQTVTSTSLSTAPLTFQPSNVTNTGCDVTVRSFESSSKGAQTVWWVAIGPA